MSKKTQQSSIALTQVIEIPEGSLVLMCAAPNSGKTHFTKKHFATLKNVTLICSDDLFREQAEKASLFETYEGLMKKTTNILETMLLDGVSKGHTVVIDATSHFLDERLRMIEEIGHHFKNIVLIVIDLDFNDLLKHGVKPQSELMKRFDMYAPEIDNTQGIAMLIKLQFMNGTIYKGVNKVYRVTSQTLNNCKVFIK